MKIYEEDFPDGHFYCFGCQKHGDLISFVAYMEACSPGQAISKLSTKFNVELVTLQDMPNVLVESLTAILGKKAKEQPKEVTEQVRWQIIAEKARREFEVLDEHKVPYLVQKKLPHIGTKSKWDILVVPMYDMDMKLWSMQLIYADGSKKFLPDARKKDLMLVLGDPQQPVNYICEGWATGASVFVSTGVTTYVSFNAGNIDSVALQIKSRYPCTRVIVAGDNDEPGHCHHQQAMYPPEYKQDWSDIYVKHGAEAVNKFLVSV
jgi:phage/plasmid primase-like uncharacterized protein